MPTPEEQRASISVSPDPRPIILLIHSQDSKLWDAVYTDMAQKILDKANIKKAEDPQSAILCLDNDNPRAVIVTHGAYAEADPRFVALDHKFLKYVREGGTVVLGTLFSSSVKPLSFNRWMNEAWNVAWEYGNFLRTDVFLNPDCDLEGFRSDELWDSYSQKAVFLKNVGSEATVYTISRNSRTQSSIFPAENVDVGQSPVVFARVGRGRLGFIGDVNNEEGSIAVVMMMCRL